MGIRTETVNRNPDKERKMKGILSSKEAADYLGVRNQTLAVWRSTNRYNLPYIKVGAAVKYRQSDIDEWLEKRTVGNKNGKTSQKEPVNIHTLQWSVRARKTMKRLGITTINELCKKNTYDLLEVKYCGCATVREIVEKLKEEGFKLIS